MIKKIRNAFTMIELIFVIIVIGLLSTFGVEFMVQTYQSYIFSNINNRLQNESATAVEFIAKRLSHRIKDSVMARHGAGFNSISDINNTLNYTILEWIGSDIDGWRGNSLPLWSGIIDLGIDATDQNLRLVSPETNTTAMNGLINTLSYTNSDINDSALYFIGSNSDINISYGWSGANGDFMQDQNGSMHPINNNDANLSEFLPIPTRQDFKDVDVYEYYKHAWTAYAIVHSDDGNLTLHYNYQPWDGEKYDTAGQNIQTALIMQNVKTFQYRAIGSLIKIQVCVASELTGEEYAICKEKTIY